MPENDVESALAKIIDPELGINIVDLGLVHTVTTRPDEIEVALIMTTPSCPLGEMLVQQAEEALTAQFPDLKSVRVTLLRDVPWSPDRMTKAGRHQLGLE